MSMMYRKLYRGDSKERLTTPRSLKKAGRTRNIRLLDLEDHETKYMLLDVGTPFWDKMWNAC